MKSNRLQVSRLRVVANRVETSVKVSDCLHIRTLECLMYACGMGTWQRGNFMRFRLEPCAKMVFSWLLVVIFAFLCGGPLDLVSCTGEIVYAFNAGGEAHTDVNGVHYQRDPLHGKTGTPSDFGKQLLIGRVPPADMILYQTERYHHSTFGYDIPIQDDGHYVLVLKFCEVYFTSPNMKVFDVVVNHAITVISGLDIYDKVGRGIAHDEYVSFAISKDKLKLGEEEYEFDGLLRVDFIKGAYDNPKVNAIYVMKGKLDDIVKLSPLEIEEEPFKESAPVDEKTTSKNRRPSGPRNPNPYGLDESSTMLPIFIAIFAFIPILFCLCKL